MKISIALTIISLLFLPVASRAASGDFVRTANYYLLSGSALESASTIATLAEFDLIVIPSEAQSYNRAFFSSVRALNPDIVILAYVPTVSWNNAYWSDPLHAEMKKGIKDSWWLRDEDGNKTSIWPNTYALDLNSGWTDYLATFVDEKMRAASESTPSGDALRLDWPRADAIIGNPPPTEVRRLPSRHT